ncbi:hypothetical protein G3485_21005 [Shewanella baltica]|jgi:hypothetical protein|uniref:hypothetical protein n=1 Tax=Shewanella baltica TaxID=62322 RepID=UPI00217D3EB9|nr:hypothetical protein [Shewanella baltica]MCS6129576.1 hypothetical protein [Shewanella baltica]MCS6141512.1 hypothetical protein [Shewanella baltica]MCS6147846.1 hypothetical protein [Shewanella baltica]MCS6172375.1 hypothetical protein [Shewanella baltica]MCS6189599.1 hypothetical protein [Shewanella baltica]
MRDTQFDFSMLMSSKMFGVLALLLLVVAVELSIGEANSWFFLGLNVLEWTNPLEEVRQVGEVSVESADLILGVFVWLLESVVEPFFG